MRLSRAKRDYQLPDRVACIQSVVLRLRGFHEQVHPISIRDLERATREERKLLGIPRYAALLPGNVLSFIPAPDKAYYADIYFTPCMEKL